MTLVDDPKTHARLETLNNSVVSGNGSLDSVINTDGSLAGSEALLVAGVYNASMDTVQAGQSHAVMIGEEGAVVTRTRCTAQALNDNVNNTQDLPLSCNGDFVVYPVFNLMHDADSNKWVRIKGSAEQGLIVHDASVSEAVASNTSQIVSAVNGLSSQLPSLREYRELGQCFIATCDLAGVANNETAYLSNSTGDKVYLVYNITMNSQYLSTSTDRLSMTMYFGNSVYSSGGTAVQVANMKLFDTAIYSDVSVVGHGTSVTFSTANNYEVDHFTSTAAGTSMVSREYPEFIEIPSGTCIFLKSDTASTASDAKITFRWVELDA